MTGDPQPPAAPPDGPPPGAAGAGRRYLAVVVILILFGWFLRRETLLIGFVADDYAQLGMLQGHYPVPRSPLDLFKFSDGSAGESAALIRSGFYPWFAHPELRLTMLRPLASAMIWLDFTLFGANAGAHHLHSLLWWLVLLGAVAWLFRRLFRPAIALLAFAFVVLDEAHNVPLAWLANRCALVSVALSVLALISHLRWREGGGRGFAVLSAALVTLALGFGEYALPMLAYFAAYELGARRGEPLRARLRALAPAGVPGLVYLALRVVTGGARHSGLYASPGEPLAFAGMLLERVPVLFADLLLGARGEFWTFGLPGTAAMVDSGWLPVAWLWTPEPWRRLHVALGVAALGVLLLTVVLSRRALREPNVRWPFLASLASVVPVAASVPSSRLLLPALVGFAPLLAAFVVTAVERLAEAAPLRPRTWAGVFAVIAAGSYHVFVPFWHTRLEVVGMLIGSDGVRRAALELAADPAALPGQRVVVLAARDGGSSMYLPLTRRLFGKPWPRRCHTLSFAGAPQVLLRDGPRSFHLYTTGGFTQLSTAPEHLLRDPREAPRVGDTVDADGMRVTVIAARRGLPSAIRVEFDVPLEDPSLAFVLPGAAGIGPVRMPALGETITVPAPVM